MVHIKRSIYSKLSHRGSDRSLAAEVSFRIVREADSFSYNLSLAKQGEKSRSENKFITNCCIAVLTRCTDELKLLTNVFAKVVEPYTISTLDYRSTDERFGHADGKFEDHRINAQYTDTHKLQKDISVIIYLLRTLTEEVLSYGTFSNVRTYMQNLEDMSEDEENLIQDLSEKLNMITYMRLACVKEKTMSTSVITNFNDSLREVMRVYQDQSEYGNEEVKFVRKWQKARHEQNHLTLKQKEFGYKSTTDTMNWKIKLEDRCHEELETYMAESYKDYMDEIQNWMDQYERDLENRDTDIYNVNVDIEKLTDKHQALKEEYEKRAQKMEEWREYKRKKKEEEERIALENWAATKIQAWWRGVMVRKNLGPYRKHKGKKGGKAKGQKKGKKK